ncbi:methylated-DNA--[protein]-cysteine S-methyltransferase [Parasutterella excrementihominis]|uniref:methylated-DNA--[protein]-cysteine S-methyltransferase n=1 Tax=Parasutterella excrementihominis TaxID=487175 RepID=UPI00266F65E8|nr:methylated-DNA--[protein]-cysteine S-methyltransferase [Parasutterella excrementihominis]
MKGDIHALDNWAPSDDGTEFRRRVWKEITKVKAGDTVTYGQIADSLDSAPRAVGAACGDNPLPIFVGCHRVVGKSNLGGFAHSADNVSIKCWLLKHEQQNM